MCYAEILKQLATKENKTEKEIDAIMQQAIEKANIDCTVEEFIQIVSFFVQKRRYIA